MSCNLQNNPVIPYVIRQNTTMGNKSRHLINMLSSRLASIFSQMFSLAYVILFCIFVACPAAGKSISPEQAHGLLTNALNYSQKISFSSVVWNDDKAPNKHAAKKYFYNGNMMSYEIYNRTGELISQRLAVPNENKRWEWFLNENGDILGKTILQTNNYATVILWDCVRGLLDDEHFSSANCEITSSDYKHIPCQRISISFPVTDDMMIGAPITRFNFDRIARCYNNCDDLIHQKITAKTMSSGAGKLARDAYYAGYAIYIDKKTSFIYQCTTFDSSGNVFINFEFGEVNFNPIFTTEDYFSLPHDCKTEICNSYQTRANRSFEIRQNSPWWQRSKILYILVLFVRWIVSPVPLFIVLAISFFVTGIVLRFKRQKR